MKNTPDTNSITNQNNILENYTQENAQLDNCFVINSNSTNNNYLYSQFMSNYRNWISSFIRVVKNTSTNNTVIYDILYKSDENKFFIVIDNTRNKSLPPEEQTISLKEFEQIGEYRHENILYWIAFNGNLTQETFQNNTTLIITELY